MSVSSKKSREKLKSTALKAGRDLRYSKLKPEQLQVVCAVLRECDMFAISPTGFENCLCLACLPLTYDHLYPSSELSKTHDWYC